MGLRARKETETVRYGSRAALQDYCRAIEESRILREFDEKATRERFRNLTGKRKKKENKQEISSQVFTLKIFSYYRS